MSEEASPGGDDDCGHDDHDLDTLRQLVTDLERASDSLIEYGDDHDIPAIEHNAQRIRDSTRILEQNVPRGSGGETGREEAGE